ncbi:MAG TPA: NUDIX hydrolase [Mollicutes bacterium]|nr:NUDIX hydrolase [Mollicutes bacterium]
MNNEEGYLLVVGTAFIRNGKVLVSMSKRSAKKGKYTLVGGGVETYDGSFRRAAKRECEEEIANGFVIDEKQLVPIIVFREPALSDPSINIEMHMYLSLKDIDVDIEPNDEIVEYRWFTLGEDESILSTAVKDHFIPWAKKNNIMY